MKQIKKKAFSLIELLIVISIIALLAALLLPALASAKESAKRIQCVNNLKNLGISVQMYVDEHEESFPARGGGNYWPEELGDYYQTPKILYCPSDAPNPVTFGNGNTNEFVSAKRSYLFNGFNDYFGGLPKNGTSVKENSIEHTSETILFGEKEPNSGHFWMDYWAGDDYQELDLVKHKKGSNYGFADGSARYLLFGKCFDPINLWFLSDSNRNLQF